MADNKNPDLYDLVRGFQAHVREGTDFSDAPRILHESNTGVDPKTGRPYAVSAMTGEKHWGSAVDAEINTETEPQQEDMLTAVKEAILEVFVLHGEVRTTDVFDHLKMNGYDDDRIDDGLAKLGNAY